jgi:hypothetical protein
MKITAIIDEKRLCHIRADSMSSLPVSSWSDAPEAHVAFLLSIIDYLRGGPIDTGRIPCREEPLRLEDERRPYDEGRWDERNKP